MIAYKLIWNFQERFRNIVVYPGDFHFMKDILHIVLNAYTQWTEGNAQEPSFTVFQTVIYIKEHSNII